MDKDFKKYYDDEMSLAEQADFQRRLTEDDGSLTASMREAFDEICAEMEDNSSEADRVLARNSFNAIASSLGLRTPSDIEARKKQRRYTFFKWATGIAACTSLVLMFSLAWILNKPQPEAEWVELSVPNGTTSELLLSDGTKLCLNAGTRVTYPTFFNTRERKIFVEGEIIAHVAKDPEHPFVVHTDDMDIRVLGTTFNLKSYRNSDCVEVFLLEGKVQCDVNLGEEKTSITMHPGNVVHYERSTGDLDVTNFSVKGFESFHDSGAMHFFNLSLADILKDLERQFDTEIILMNDKWAQTRYFALFTNGESLEEVLRHLNTDNLMKITEADGKIYIK